MTNVNGAASRAALATLTVVIEAANDRGIKANGTWIDYGRIFSGDKLGKDAVGRTMELTLVESKKDGVQYIRSVRTVEDASADAAEGATESVSLEDVSSEPSTPAAPDAASPQQIEYAEDLAKKAGISSNDLAALVRLRFKKEWDALTKFEASLLIRFVGGFSYERRRSS